MTLPPEIPEESDTSIDEESSNGSGLSSNGSGLSIGRIEIFNLLMIFGVLLIALLLGHKEVAKGVGAGGAISALSFRAIAYVLGLAFKKSRIGCFPLILTLTKFGLIMIAMGSLILVYNVDILGILIGTSMIMPSILLEALINMSAAKKDQ
jgi:hypothetical protein